MKYVNKLTDEQIKEILQNIYFKKSNIESKEYFEDCLTVEISNLYNDRFDLTDYDISAIDFYISNEYEINIEYRKKMLEYFGEQYAIDYLLGEWYNGRNKKM